jgi:hypothetical protein
MMETVLLHRWIDTNIHYFGSRGEQHNVFSALHGFGATAPTRAGASRLLHQNLNVQKKHHLFWCAATSKIK